MSKIIQLFIPLLFCGDQISDIWYLIQNWDSFANQDLKNSALAFTLINGIINFFMTIVVAIFLKSCKNMSAQKQIALFLFCGCIPLFLIVFVLLYSKFFDLLEKWNYLDRVFDQDHIKQVKSIFQILCYTELFLQDIPQIIIQSINNNQTNQWQLLEYISLGFSVGVILYELIKFTLCKEQQDEKKQKIKKQSSNINQSSSNINQNNLPVNNSYNLPVYNSNKLPPVYPNNYSNNYPVYYPNNQPVYYPNNQPVYYSNTQPVYYSNTQPVYYPNIYNISY